MALILDTAMSFTMVAIMTGVGEGFLERFAVAWLIGFAVGFPTSAAAMPLVSWVVKKSCRAPDA